MSEMLGTILTWTVVALIALAIVGIVSVCGYSLTYEEGQEHGEA